MNIYLFDGVKISMADPRTLVGKKFYVENIFHIATTSHILSGGDAPEIIKFTIGQDTTSDKLELLYTHSGWVAPYEDCDLDDLYECTTVRSELLSQDSAQKLLFCLNEKNVKKYNIFHAIDSHLKPNRALLEVKLLGVDMILTYITTDLSLKANDKIIVLSGRYSQIRGVVTEVRGTYLEYFGQNNLSIACNFREYYTLHYVERNTNDDMFALQDDLMKNPINKEYKPSNCSNLSDTKNYLTVTFNHEGTTKSCVIVCTKDKSKVKETILRLTEAYKTKNKEYNDICRYCAFHRGITFNSLPQFVIYVIIKYYNLGWRKDVTIDSMKIEY